MYKTLVRSHLDYCDIIYHKPSYQNQPPIGVTLNLQMEKVERIQYQAQLLLFLVHGLVRVVQNSMRN